MSKLYLTSDWHLGHTNVAKWRVDGGGTPFSVETHDEYLLDMYLNTVKKRDIVYFLGDIIMSRKYLEVVRDLPGRKILIMGNHDDDHLSDRDDPITCRELVNVYDAVHGFHRKNRLWLSHAPIHPSELRGKFNVHGHTHQNNIDDTRYYNVCVEQTGYQLILWQEVLGYLHRVNSEE